MNSIPEETKQEIYQKWRYGLTHKELSKAYHIPYPHVRRIINKLLAQRAYEKELSSYK